MSKSYSNTKKAMNPKDFARILFVNENNDPEAAKQYFENMPIFAKLAEAMGNKNEEAVEAALKSNDDSMNKSYSESSEIINFAEELLNNEKYPHSEKMEFLDKILSLKDKDLEKDSENKKFILEALKTFGKYTLAISLLVIGGKSAIKYISNSK